MSWRVATVVALEDQTATARTIVLDVAGWPGHDAGQHVDVRLTAPDGYSAARSYSIASAVDAQRIELAVERLPDGEVSPYLAEELVAGDLLEIRGPVGGWFVWRPDQPEPVQLLAGGSGVVPLLAMARAHAMAGSRAPIRLLYSVRDPASVLYAPELDRLAGRDGGLELTYAYTRIAPEGSPRPPG
ncbi:MAG: FAD-binding oxidoreductase, partial [Acidimicrobiales bacterium]